MTVPTDRFTGRLAIDWNGHVQEKIAQPAASAAALKAATATVAAQVVLTASDLIAGGKTVLLATPRKLTFTTAGVTPASAPANVAIVGTGWDGNALSETLNLAQTADMVTSVNRYKTITSLTYPAADDVDATVAIGYAADTTFWPPCRKVDCTGAGDLVFELPDGNQVTRTLAVGDTLESFAIAGFVSCTGTVEFFR